MRKPFITVIAAAVALALVLGVPVSVAQGDVRHTPGFPAISLENMLQILQSLIEGLHDSELSVDDVDKVEDVVQYLVNEGVVDQSIAEAVSGYAYSGIDVMSELEKISNAYLRRRLQSLVSTPLDKLSLDDINKLLSEARYLYSSGAISYEDYIRTLKIVRWLFNSMEQAKLQQLINSVSDPELRKYLESLIDMYRRGEITRIELVNKLLQYMNAHQLESGDYSVVNSIYEVLTRYGEYIKSIDAEWLSRVGDLLDRVAQTAYPFYRPGPVLSVAPMGEAVAQSISGAPSVSPPSIALPSPVYIGAEGLAAVLILIATAVAAILLVRVLGKRLKGAILLPRRAKLKGMPMASSETSLHRILEIYWRSVEIVERAIKVCKGGSETHREFLSRVRESLGEAAGAFGEITRVYEVYRFGGVESPELARSAEERFSYLVKVLGVG